MSTTPETERPPGAPSVNPYSVLRDWDQANRKASRHINKAMSLARALHQAPTTNQRDSRLGQLLDQLQRAAMALDPPTLTQYRQLTPRQRQVAPGLPPGNVCKKCHQEKPDAEFSFDDGTGLSGYTGRCADCRGAKGRAM